MQIEKKLANLSGGQLFFCEKRKKKRESEKYTYLSQLAIKRKCKKIKTVGLLRRSFFSLVSICSSLSLKEEKMKKVQLLCCKQLWIAVQPIRLRIVIDIILSFL